MLDLLLAYVGDGNDAKPINDGRCCDQCHTRHVIPERARRDSRK
jgi:hypothetical protein